jgi:hypothetical protein
VTKAIVSPLQDRFSVEVENGDDLEAKGNVLDHEFKIERGGDRPDGARRVAASALTPRAIVSRLGHQNASIRPLVNRNAPAVPSSTIAM